MVLNFKASFNAARPQVSLHAPTGKPTVEGHKHCTSRSHIAPFGALQDNGEGLWSFISNRKVG